MEKRVIALGFFDGVHIGHGALLNKTKALAQELGATPAVMTFDTHPEKQITGRPVPLICSPEDRADIIHRIYGIADVLFLHFDDETMKMPWPEFVEQLVENFGAVALVAGHDFHFGYKGEGNPQRLMEKCRALGIGCSIVPRVEKDGVTVSSTYIRELLVKGELQRANAFLGHPYCLTDAVHSGYRLGRSMGTPTINMRFESGVLVPARGVYATRVFWDGGVHDAVTNIGTRPTVDQGDDVSVESFILHFQGNLYGKRMRLEFYEFIRPERRFPDTASLRQQILADAQSAADFLQTLPRAGAE